MVSKLWDLLLFCKWKCTATKPPTAEKTAIGLHLLPMSWKNMWETFLYPTICDAKMFPGDPLRFDLCVCSPKAIKQKASFGLCFQEPTTSAKCIVLANAQLCKTFSLTETAPSMADNLKETRNMSPEKSWSQDLELRLIWRSILHPGHYDAIIEAVKETGQFKRCNGAKKDLISAEVCCSMGPNGYLWLSAIVKRLALSVWFFSSLRIWRCRLLLTVAPAAEIWKR